MIEDDAMAAVVAVRAEFDRKLTELEAQLAGRDSIIQTQQERINGLVATNELYARRIHDLEAHITELKKRAAAALGVES